MHHVFLQGLWIRIRNDFPDLDPGQKKKDKIILSNLFSSVLMGFHYNKLIFYKFKSHTSFFMLDPDPDSFL